MVRKTKALEQKETEKDLTSKQTNVTFLFVIRQVCYKVCY